jgi:AbrB family looped-hinge helix DNA binding protein
MTIGVVGERGQITIPKEIRQRLGIKPKSAVILEEKDGVLLVRPAAAVPIRIFSDEFIAELEKENTLKKGERGRILARWRK